jgi:hypothetical protein
LGGAAAGNFQSFAGGTSHGVTKETKRDVTKVIGVLLTYSVLTNKPNPAKLSHLSRIVCLLVFVVTYPIVVVSSSDQCLANCPISFQFALPLTISPYYLFPEQTSTRMLTIHDLFKGFQIFFDAAGRTYGWMCGWSPDEITPDLGGGHVLVTIHTLAAAWTGFFPDPNRLRRGVGTKLCSSLDCCSTIFRPRQRAR